MSILCLSHVMRHSEATLGARLVLFVLAEHAHDDGSESYPSVETLAERTRMSRRAVQSALRRLEADGGVLRDGLGPKGQTKWIVVMGGADSSPREDDEGRSSRHEGGEAASPEPSNNPNEPSSSSTARGRRSGDGDTLKTADWHENTSTEARRDAEAIWRTRRKVEGHMVTAGEIVIAAAALAEFNVQSGSEFGVGAHLVPLVMRIRERPAYDADAHVRLVQSAWRLKWWERGGRGRRPTPAVIYGNSAVFEQVVQDAVDERKGRKIEGPPAPAKRFTRED